MERTSAMKAEASSRKCENENMNNAKDRERDKLIADLKAQLAERQRRDEADVMKCPHCGNLATLFNGGICVACRIKDLCASLKDKETEIVAWTSAFDSQVEEKIAVQASLKDARAALKDARRKIKDLKEDLEMFAPTRIGADDD